MRLLGALLAGGQATRFGSDKALALWRGRTLLDHAHDVLAAECATVVVCGRVHGELPALPDRPHPGLGPLGGLAAALHYAETQGFTHVLTLPCDTPCPPRPLTRRLPPGDRARYLAAAPVIGCWPAALARPLETRLAAGGPRSVVRWAEAIGAEAVVLPPDIPFTNVNTRADLTALD